MNRLWKTVYMRPAWQDIVAGLSLFRTAFLLGVLDVRLRYRGSRIGGFWLTIAFAFMMGVMGLLYGTLFHMTLARYLPWLAVSLLLWQAGVGAIASEACSCFTNAEMMIRSDNMPFTVQALRVVVRQGVIFLYHFPVALAVVLFFGGIPSWYVFYVLPAFLLWCIDGVALCFLFGVVCARFRDIPQIIAAIMQIFFYLTPIVWLPTQLNAHLAPILLFNPFSDLIAIIRDPIMGVTPSWMAWAVAFGVSILLWASAFVFFARFRARIIYWL